MSLALDAPAPVGFAERIWRINWGLALVLTAIAGVGVLALYSAAGGRFEPWASRHAMRYGAAFAMMLVVALVHPKVWLSLAWPIYIVSMLLLVAVDVIGKLVRQPRRELDAASGVGLRRSVDELAVHLGSGLRHFDAPLVEIHSTGTERSDLTCSEPGERSESNEQPVGGVGLGGMTGRARRMGDRFGKREDLVRREEDHLLACSPSDSHPGCGVPSDGVRS